MNEINLKRLMREQGLDLNLAETTEDKALVFERVLKLIIPPKSQGDTTGFRNVTSWLKDKCNRGDLDDGNIFRRVLDFALEASGPESRKPAAVFMSILKKELGYKK
jgi:hypothetical protein